VATPGRVRQAPELAEASGTSSAAGARVSPTLRRKWRPHSLEELERKARGARDFPSYLSGLVPKRGNQRNAGDQALIDQVLRVVLRTWARIRGPVLP
jgi:hypothetical protein